MVYYKGDKIKIINPYFFVRCGYPFTKQYSESFLISEEEKDSLKKMFGGETQEFYKVLNTLSISKLKQAKFGGPTRKIYTEYKPEYQDKICTVEAKKIVRTGEYVNGIKYSDDPPYLDKIQSHVILSLCRDYYSGIFDFSFVGPCKIEAKNVQKA